MSSALLQIKKINYGSRDYELEVDLRDRVLRKPLGLAIDRAALAHERDDHHLGAFEGANLIGCLMLVRLDATTAKMRQVAIDPSAQGKRVGASLVQASEQLAHADGFEKIELSARETAVGFYLKLGYEIVGEPYLEVTIPHRKMVKRLPS